MKKITILLVIIAAAVLGILYRNGVQFPAIIKNIITSTKTKNALVYSMKSEQFGEYLTSKNGLTLYVFADDKDLKSNCDDPCAKTWPPLFFNGEDLKSFSDTLSKKMNLFKRNDGKYQYAYGQKPVYYYIGDQNPGDTKGNGIGGKWSVIPVIR